MTQVRPVYGCLFVLLMLSLVGIGLYGGRLYVLKKAAEVQAQEKLREAIAQQSAMQVQPLPGDDMLQNYAKPGTRPQDDLHALAHVFSNLALLIKSEPPFRMGANEEFAAALRGQNAVKLNFVSEGSRAFNAQGQVIDRWGNALFFHVSDRTRIDIRSAGPDRQLWTDDDLHRRYDGQFLKGDALNPTSLYEERKTR